MAGSKIAWGLDVGTTSLKAIKLRLDGGKVSVEAFDVVEHDKFLSEPDIDRDEVIRHTLTKFLERNPVKRDTVFIGVPGSTTFARFVKLPPVEPKKIPEIVRFEAIQQIPFPLDQVNWDYQTFQSADSPDVEVGIFAMKKELVTQVLSNFQQSNMTVHGVQMSPLAVYNAAVYDGMSEGKGTVIIDIGAEHTDLIVSDQGRLWMRTINIGGNNFTDALAKSFKQPFSRAEQLKKNAATSKYAKQIFQAMRPIFADLVAEIQRSIGHYNSTHRDSKLERIIGMGNPFRLPNLQKYLQQELKLDVVRLESFKKISAESRLAAGLQENILAMSGAYGLALQGLELATIDTSLLPVEIARQMLWRKKQLWFIGATAAVVVGVAALGFRVWGDRGNWETLASLQATNNTKILAAKKLTSDYKSKGLSFDNDKAIVEGYVKLADQRSIWPYLVRDIYEALPQATKPSDQALGGPGRSITVLSVMTEYVGSLSTLNLASSTEAPAAAGAAGKVYGPSDRGFKVVIEGYTPHSQGRQLVVEYIKSLNKISPLSKATEEKPARPYYFDFSEATEVRYDGSYLRSPASGSTSSIPKVWGNVHGPYWDAFIPEMLGLHAPTPGMPVVDVNFGASGKDIEGPIDAMIQVVPPKDGKPGTGPTFMYGYDRFTLTFKVHVR